MFIKNGVFKNALELYNQFLNDLKEEQISQWEDACEKHNLKEEDKLVMTNKVKPNDTVFHLGDFSFRGGFHQYQQKLNGTIVLLAGNHDETSFSVIRDITIKHGGKEFYLTHVPPENQINDFCLCGHVHGKWKSKRNGNKIIVNVGVDVWNFEPVSIKSILKEIEILQREK